MADPTGDPYVDQLMQQAQQVPSYPAVPPVRHGRGIGPISGGLIDSAAPALLSVLQNLPQAHYGTNAGLVNTLNAIGQVAAGTRMNQYKQAQQENADQQDQAKAQYQQEMENHRNAATSAAMALANWRHYGANGPPQPMTPADKVKLAGDTEAAKLKARIAAGGAAPGAPKVGATGAAPQDDHSYLWESDPYGGQYLPQNKINALPAQERSVAMNEARQAGIPVLSKEQDAAVSALGTARDNLKTMLQNIDLLPDSKKGLSLKRGMNWIEQTTGVGADAPRLRTLRQSMDATFQGAKALVGAGSGLRSSRELLKMSNQINAPQAIDTRQMAIAQAKQYKEYFNNVARHLGLKSVPGQGQDELDQLIDSLEKNPKADLNAPGVSPTQAPSDTSFLDQPAQEPSPPPAPIHAQKLESGVRYAFSQKDPKRQAAVLDSVMTQAKVNGVDAATAAAIASKVMQQMRPKKK